MATSDRKKIVQLKKKGARPASGKNTNQHTSDRDMDEGTEAARNSPETSVLYIVATPIGHMGDMTERARQVLASVNLILCEDTRTTGMLLKRLGLSSSLMSYHEHNAHRVRPHILERLQQGQRIALVSDAGTPLISDPGYKLVHDALEYGTRVVPVPGACALITALMGAGQPTDCFLFSGFLPARQKARCDILQTLASIKATLIFYESVHRLAESLMDMSSIFGPRSATVCRELTKLHENIQRDTLNALAAHYASHPTPKGEVVVVVAPPSEQLEEKSSIDIDHLLGHALRYLSVRDAAALVSEQSGIRKSQVYARALALGRPH